MTTFTNEIEVTIDFEALRSAYDFYAITIPAPDQLPREKRKGYYAQTYKEIVATFAPKARTLLRERGSNVYVFAKERGERLPASDRDIRKMGLSSLRDMPRKNILAMLFSLMAGKSSFFGLSADPYNIYYTYEIKPSKLTALELQLKEARGHLYLSLGATSFKKAPKRAKEGYVEERGLLIPYRPEIHKGETVYVKGNYAASRVTVPFFGVTWSTYPQSKIHYLNRIVRDINTHLSKYLTLGFKRIPYEVYADGKDKEKRKAALEKHIEAYTHKIGSLHIANLSGDAGFGERLHRMVQEKFGEELILTHTTELSDASPQLTITLPEEAYKDEPETDPYLRVRASKTPSQNITTDTKLGKAVISVLLKELALKCELGGYGIFLEHSYFHECRYIHIEDSAKSLFHKATLSNGTITTASLTDEEQTVCESAMFEVPSGDVAEAVIFSGENIMLLTRTPLSPLPDFSTIEKWYEEETEPVLIDRVTLLAYLEREGMDVEAIGKALDSISTGAQISSSKIMARSSKEISKGIKNKIEAFAGRPLRFNARSEERKKSYGGMLGITYARLEDGSVLYHTGLATGNLDTKVERNSPYRRVIPIKGSVDLGAILPFMEEYFVKYGELTVLPYPLKYAREGIIF